MKLDFDKLKGLDKIIVQECQAMLGGKFAPPITIEATNIDIEVLITEFNIVMSDTVNKVLGKHRQKKKALVTIEPLDRFKERQTIQECAEQCRIQLN